MTTKRAVVDFACRCDGMGMTRDDGSYIKIVVIEDDADAVHHFHFAISAAEALGVDLIRNTK